MYRKYNTMSSSNEILSRVEFIDTSLCLIRIPRQRLPELVHPIVSLLLRPHPTFQSFTFNDQEAVLFVEASVRREFEQFASCYRSQSTSSPDSDVEDADSLLNDEPTNEVTISPLTWNVLSLDMAENSERLHELLQPLTSSNIPIFYQSAMNSDYLFVASQHLPTALKILNEIGFVLSDDESYTNRLFMGGRHPSSARTQRQPKRQNTYPGVPGVPEVSNRSPSPHFLQIGANGVDLSKGADSVFIKNINGNGVNGAKGPHTSTTRSPISGSVSGSRKRAVSTGHVRPVRLLSHTVAFHGLNTGGPGSDDSWLLKIIKMIGWPESLLPPRSSSQSSASSRQRSRARAQTRAQPGYGGYGVYGCYGNNSNNNIPRSCSPSYKPIRPRLISRHSADRFTKSSNDIIAISPNNLQEKYASRSRSTSYPDVAPEFFQNYRAGAHYRKMSNMGTMGTSVLGLHQMDPLFQVVPPVHLLGSGSGSSSVSSSLAQSQAGDIDCNTSKPNRRRSVSSNFSSSHTRTLPFFSFTRRAGQSKDDQPEVAIMTRGRLLAQAFDSSMLIGGSGDVAVSDTEDDELYEDLAFYGGYLPNPRQDEGYRCLQIEMNSFEEGHHEALTRIADTLNNKSIRYHFSSLLETINILVPEASAREALELLQNTSL